MTNLDKLFEDVCEHLPSSLVDEIRSNWNDFTLIRSDALNDLQRADAKLNALEGSGVDNWQGYEYAMELFAEWYPELLED